MDGKAGAAGGEASAEEVGVYVHWVNGLRCGRERLTADGRRYVCMHPVVEGKVGRGTDRRDDKIFSAGRCATCWGAGCEPSDWSWQEDLVAYRNVSEDPSNTLLDLMGAASDEVLDDIGQESLAAQVQMCVQPEAFIGKAKRYTPKEVREFDLESVREAVSDRYDDADEAEARYAATPSAKLEREVVKVGAEEWKARLGTALAAVSPELMGKPPLTPEKAAEIMN